MSDQPERRYTAEDFADFAKFLDNGRNALGPAGVKVARAAFRMAAAVETPGLIEDIINNWVDNDWVDSRNTADKLRKAIRKGAAVPIEEPSPDV